MKAVYWRPERTSPSVLLTIGLVSIAGLTGLFCLSITASGGDSKQNEVAAARLADKCLRAIKAKRLELGHPIDHRFDPHQTGIIGEPISAATSKAANLSAKQVSVNPNFAAAVVRMLVEAGVQPGDTIAVGWSGSFPALNVALCAAIETMELNPIIVASALSSQYGANLDEYLWLDMEEHLAESGLIGFRSSAMTVGGAADRAFRQSSEAEDVARQAQLRTSVDWLKSSRLKESISARMEFYERVSHNGHIAAYVNVGGGIASMGGEQSTTLRPGLNRPVRSIRSLPDCVARRFADQSTPIIHLAQARRLAEQYRLNTDLTIVPTAGVGPIFQRQQPSRVLAAALLFVICGLLYAFVSRDYGYRALDLIAGKLRIQARDQKVRVVGVESQLMA